MSTSFNMGMNTSQTLTPSSKKAKDDFCQNSFAGTCHSLAEMSIKPHISGMNIARLDLVLKIRSVKSWVKIAKISERRMFSKASWIVDQVSPMKTCVRHSEENGSQKNNKSLKPPSTNQLLRSRTTHSRIPSQSSGHKRLGLPIRRHGSCRNSYCEQYQKRCTAAAVS
jgi:hypothetical protein